MLIQSIISKAKEFISKSSEKKEEYYRRPTDFSRTRKLPLLTVVLVLLNLPKRSLTIELEAIQSELNCPNVDSSAFSHARKKLQWVFLLDLFEEQVSHYYSFHEASEEADLCLKRWEGHLVYGVDGTRLYLISTPDVLKEFGSQDNQHGSVAMAQVVCTQCSSF